MAISPCNQVYNMTYYKISHALSWLAVLAATSLLCFSCQLNQQSRHRAELDHIDSVILQAPDSALALLNGMSEETKGWQKSDRMHYELLTIKATDKARLPLENESAINKIVAYYEDHTDDYLLANAYYYAGRTKVQENDALLALDYFNKAQNLIHEDSVIPLNVAIQLQKGYIYRNQGFFLKERDAHRNAYRYSQHSKDTVNMIFSIRDIGGTYESLENYDSCNWYLHAALKLAESANNERMIRNIMMSLTDNYKYLNQYDSAKYFFLQNLDNVGYSSLSPLYSNATEIYEHYRMDDSARYYAAKLLQIGNAFGKRCAYRNLTRLDLRRHDVEGAKRNFEQYVAYVDSTNQLRSEEALANAMSLYDYSEYVKVSEKAKADSKRKNTWIWMIGIVLLTTLFTSYHYIQQLKKKKREEENKRYLLQSIIDQNKSESKQDIIQKQDKIDELNERITTINANNSEILEKLKKEKEILEEELKREKEKNRQTFETDRIEKFNSIKYKLLRMAEEENAATDEVMKEMNDFFNQYYVEFLTKLYSFTNPTTMEQNVCMMLKMNIKVKYIAILVGRSMQTISTMRARLYMRAFHKKAPAEEFDKFIHCL